MPAQAIVEFALVSTIFLMIVFGTIDFGRAIFVSSELHNAVREGARYGKFNPDDHSGIANRVVAQAPGSGLTAGAVSISCTGGCEPMEDRLTVTATVQFTAVTQSFLGISPITLRSTATVDIE